MVSNVQRTINQKIQDRANEEIKSRKVGEDQVGDLFDESSTQSKGALKKILKYKFHILLFRYFNLRPGNKYLIFCEQAETTLLVDHDGVVNTGKSLSRLQLKILNLLSTGGATKQKLIEEAWGYEYDILRHDPLIYTTMGRLRKLLGTKKKWLYSEDQSYYLDEEVELVFPTLIKSIAKPKTKKKVDFPNLNHRQIQFLSEGDSTPLSVSEYGEKWKVTRMTALRDLKSLTDKKLVQRIGKGKGTRYILSAY